VILGANECPQTVKLLGYQRAVERLPLTLWPYGQWLHLAETKDYEDRESFEVVLLQKFQAYQHIVQTLLSLHSLSHPQRSKAQSRLALIQHTKR
jgi:hypothetical protein